jgi:hypothetical protein
LAPRNQWRDLLTRVQLGKRCERGWKRRDAEVARYKDLMSSSVAYHLVGQSSTDPDPDFDDDETSSNAETVAMTQRLGTFRAVYVVALCSIGSFLFAYVGHLKANQTNHGPQLT